MHEILEVNKFEYSFSTGQTRANSLHHNETNLSNAFLSTPRNFVLISPYLKTNRPDQIELVSLRILHFHLHNKKILNIS